MRLLLTIFFIFIGLGMLIGQSPNTNTNYFKQLGQELPTPNTYRTASGAPGEDYWQQKVDYDMKIEIDDAKQKLYGQAEITYENHSPDDLSYLWVQLDQNIRAPHSEASLIREARVDADNTRSLMRMNSEFDGGFKIDHVQAEGEALKYTINGTMMRVDLPHTLKSGHKFTFEIKWWYNINNSREVGGRSGYEHFPEDGNNVYTIAQFFPRLAKYYDVYGWQNKQFLGRGEFTLEFGDYDVEITVPADHLVAATGTLQNENVLPAVMKKRLAEAKNEFEQPVLIATAEEADKRMAQPDTINKKTWKFKAENVRDFAFATSRRFIWDALNTQLPNGETAMAMSMWVKEGDCLWSKYSTKAVAHALKWYSHYTLDYPYPVAWSIDGSNGMEYPMISFNFGRCEIDGTYTQRMKYGHIGVIIHEVGHNFFPMIVNSDERQWTWMDEGLNTFVQYLTEQQFERNYPSRRGTPAEIVDYMSGDKANLSPIMTNSESIHQFGPNAYAKPAVGLNILRETIMGRELFDHAFKTYSERWKFKTPTPADFFRTMEDASAVDLDWFWRGWFYTTDHVDLAINNMSVYKVDDLDPDAVYAEVLKKRAEAPQYIGHIRDREQIEQTYTEMDSTLVDYYTFYDEEKPDNIDREEYKKLEQVMGAEGAALMTKNKYLHEMSFEKIGGIPMPIILRFNYEDGSDEVVRIPAEIWRRGDNTVTKVFPRNKQIISVDLDPFLEIADTDRSNNAFPPKTSTDRFELFKRNLDNGENPMQRNRRAEKLNRS